MRRTKSIEHNHLDQGRRDPGECPACDVAWERQRLRLSRPDREKAVRQIEALMKRAEKASGESSPR